MRAIVDSRHAAPRCYSVTVALMQVCDREGRARHARPALRPPGLSRHGGALDEAARLLPEAETHQQPPGPVRTRRCLSCILFNRRAVRAMISPAAARI